jgi:prophage antirepressor-like protein
MSNPSPESGLQLFDVAGSGIRFGTAEDGRPYAVATDFTKIMGYLQSSDATRLLEADEKGQQIVLTPGGSQKMNVIFEDGMWELIFRSSLPGAKAIKKRVKEILREIRETGRYVAGPAVGAQLQLDREVKELQVAKGRAEVLAILRQGGVVDAGYLDACGRRLAGRVLGETPELDPLTKPLTVSIYLGEQGLTSTATRKLAGNFGKSLKAAYISMFDEEPSQIEDLVGRHTVMVAQYQERHRPLFDQVYNSLVLSSA